MKPCQHRIDLKSLYSDTDGVTLWLSYRCRLCQELGAAVVDTSEEDWEGDGLEEWNARNTSTTD